MTKTKRELTTFECDHCKKRSEEREADNCFPYERGWVYIYRIDFKVATNKINRMKDKHFCSKECFDKALNKFMEEALKMCCLFG